MFFQVNSINSFESVTKTPVICGKNRGLFHKPRIREPEPIQEISWNLFFGFVLNVAHLSHWSCTLWIDQEMTKEEKELFPNRQVEWWVATSGGGMWGLDLIEGAIW